jgi:hypothetical protein
MGDRGALVKRRVDGIVTKIINGASPYCNSVIAQLRAPEFSFLYLAFWLRRIYFVLPANEKQRDYALAYGKKRKSLGFRLEAAKDIIGPADPFEHIDLRHPPPLRPALRPTASFTGCLCLSSRALTTPNGPCRCSCSYLMKKIQFNFLNDRSA